MVSRSSVSGRTSASSMETACCGAPFVNASHAWATCNDADEERASTDDSVFVIAFPLDQASFGQRCDQPVGIGFNRQGGREVL